MLLLSSSSKTGAAPRPASTVAVAAVAVVALLSLLLLLLILSLLFFVVVASVGAVISLDFIALQERRQRVLWGIKWKLTGRKDWGIFQRFTLSTFLPILLSCPMKIFFWWTWGRGRRILQFGHFAPRASNLRNKIQRLLIYLNMLSPEIQLTWD